MFKSEHILNPKATQPEIDTWFSSIPRERLIAELTDTIGEWCFGDTADVRKLKLEERGLNQEEIVKLLKAEPCSRIIPVLRLLVSADQIPTLISLLKQVSSHDLDSLIRLKDSWPGLNLLSYSFMCTSSALSRYIIKSIGEEKSFELLCERDWFGKTGLHEAAYFDKSINEVLSLVKDDDSQVFQLLCLRNDLGQTVLSLSINHGSVQCFQSILDQYADNQSTLLKLAAIPDNDGNTCFHYVSGRNTSNFLLSLIQSTYALDTRDELAKILSQQNLSGSKVKFGWEIKESHPDNGLIYDWVSEALVNNQYLLFDLPSVLVMYTTNGRTNAETEALGFVKSLEKLGLKTRPVKDFTEVQLLKEIKCSHDSLGRNGQIVALMSHGFKGCIIDSAGKEIHLPDIERAMNAEQNSPKVLILQCCQGDRRAGTPCPVTTSNQASASKTQAGGEASVSEAAASGVQAEASANSAGELEVTERDIEYEILHFCTDYKSNEGYQSNEGGEVEEDDDVAGGSTYETFYPTARDFALLMSCAPSKASKRNLFVPALGEAFTELKLNEGIAMMMMSVIRRVEKESQYMQEPSLVNRMGYGFCMKNILPLYLAGKRATRV